MSVGLTRRHDQFHGRQLHLHRLSGFGGVRARHARGASRGRRRGRGLRGRREEAAAASDHPARAGRSRSIPRFLFLNKIDRANKRIRETLATLQPASRVPLVLRQIPIWNGELIEGFVDLALERAFVYREHKASEVDRAGRRQSRPREGSALLDAGEARRSRRRADGAVARGHPAAARRGVRRSRPRTARRADLPGAARLGRARERRAAADEGAAPRSARRRRDRQAPRRARARRRRSAMCSRPCICSTAASCR